MRQFAKAPRKTGRPRERIACPYRTRVPGVIALTLYLCTGCAVNDRGLVTTRLYENDTAYVLRLEAWGDT